MTKLANVHTVYSLRMSRHIANKAILTYLLMYCSACILFRGHLTYFAKFKFSSKERESKSRIFTFKLGSTFKMTILYFII